MKKLNHIEEGVLLVTFPLMTIITLAGTAVRYFQLGNMTWSEEAARYLMIISAFLGISIGFRENSHLGLSFVVEKLPPKAKPVFEIIRFVLMLAFAVLMLRLSFRMVQTQRRLTQFSAAMHIPMWIVYMPMVLGFLLMLIRIIQSNLKHTEAKEEIL